MADDALEMATVKRALTGSRCRHPGRSAFRPRSKSSSRRRGFSRG